jgi:hypothetical protein
LAADLAAEPAVDFSDNAKLFLFTFARFGHCKPGRGSL